MPIREADAHVAPDGAASAEGLLVTRGAWHVRIGIGITLGAVIALGAITAMLLGEMRTPQTLLQYAGGFVWQAIVSAGLLAGSRVARVIAIVSAGFWLLSAVMMGTLALRIGDASAFGLWSTQLFGGALLLMAGGTALATLTPAARAYHAAQRAAQAARRKAKSLADWRRPSA